MEIHIDLTNTYNVPSRCFVRELNGDPTTWWGSNEAFCVEMLKTVGFRNLRTVGRVAASVGSSPEQIRSGRKTSLAEV
jgi:hypothetical protein